MHEPVKAPRRERVSLRDLMRWNWRTTMTVYDDGSAPMPPIQEVIAGALLKILDAVETDPSAYTLGDVVRELNNLRRALAPAAPPTPDPKAERARREAESRRRAWAAYLKAGGTDAPDPADTALADPRTPVAVLNLSIRARNALNRLNVTTLGELVARTADDLLELRNFGATSLAEVREKLAARGLALKGDPPPVGTGERGRWTAHTESG